MTLRRSDPTDVGSERRRILFIAAVLGAVAGLAAVDLVGDLREGTSLVHALVEGLIVLAGGAGLAVLLRRLFELRRIGLDAQAEAALLVQELECSRAESERWRAEARDLLAGLGELIDKQFGRWGLTTAEREVALLLLKGLSHKEVASTRAVSEATARQQAAAVYRKAGVAGRHDLAAFFLEDLLAPRSV
ncbi:MAG: hypothetical protein KDC98_26140 [Planctomycetes bacterium]|nr:hypothetical protein [Planctomycetota bacterium]